MKEFIYKMINVLTVGKGIKRHIAGFTLRMPTRYYKYFTADYELNNINFLNNYLDEGMTAIDVGAHIGLLSIIMAHKIGVTGKIIAFEPTPSTFALLEKTISINKKTTTIIPIRKAVSDKAGNTFFYVTDIEAHNSNSLSNNNRNYGNEHKIAVELVSIDEIKQALDLLTVDLIKIDAEGAELAVLKGAIKTIHAYKPKILLSLHPTSINNFGDTLTEIWDFITTNNYMVYHKNDLVTRDYFIHQKDLFDVFLLPKN